jgi:hypothetical protein
MNQDPDGAMESLSRIGFSLVAGFLVSSLGGLLLLTVTYQYMKLYEEKESNEITIAEVWQNVKAGFPAMLGAMLLYTGSFILLYVLIILFIAGIGGGPAAVLLILPVPFLMVYLAVLFALVFPIQTFEKTDVFSAFKRSAQLIKGKWWSTFGIIMVTYIVVSLINSMFTMVFSGAAMISMLHEGEEIDPSALSITLTSVSTIVSMTISQVLMVFPLLAIGFQYFNLVERKEAKGLMDKIETFGQADVATGDEEQY